MVFTFSLEREKQRKVCKQIIQYQKVINAMKKVRDSGVKSDGGDVRH